jgi:TonB family protein
VCEQSGAISKIGMVALALILIVGESVIAPSQTFAQENSAEAPKRKIQTSVVPTYPPLAKKLNVAGKVKIQVTVAPDGHVVDAKVIGGSPLLVNSALEALKKWHFEPTTKETTETVVFEFNPLNN